MPILIGTAIMSGVIYLFFHALKNNRENAYLKQLAAIGVSDPMQLTPDQYEKFCGILLSQSGWKVTQTPATRDFGADIIALRGNIKMVVQCKRYKKPVGISAVQEIHTAAQYYKANYTAVMATSGFTQPAKILAEKTGTRLIVPGKNTLHNAKDIIKIY